ncbi:MAG: hypothetical protein GC146_06870 [Limimaricola sp.]|uniref:hypothetical protein n=1 Tax=Limimaricola sp. TaxID=2211665 RepID=UPI001D473924|nr:hypothetical protein [Limimaricola sp.]MBI1416925.1 hypothetical protein [Limimaricola sp.]
MKTPWHLWLVGIVSLLWNAVGAFDYTMTQARSAWYLAQFTPEQLAYFFSYPAWVVAFWALGVWAAVLGSVLLLLRSRFAASAFLAALLGIVVTSVYTFGLAEISMSEASGSGAIVFSAAIFVVTLALWLYARAMAARGQLR